MLFKNGLVFHEGRFQRLDVRTSGDKITGVGAALLPADGEKLTDCTGKKLVPGFIDIHTHGCAGYDFSTASPEEIGRMTRAYAKKGVTSVAATPMTMAKDAYRTAMQSIKTAIDSEPAGSRIVGIYMEGPFLAKSKKGAHDAQYLSGANAEYFAELDALSGGNVRVVALDPDCEGAKDFMQKYAHSKIISVAHTACDYETACEAFRMGARDVTHLFNAMNPLHHRDPGVIGAFADFAEKGVTAELICDGFHIHRAVVRMMFKLCGEQIVLISDSMSAAGLEDGEYELGGLKVYVSGGKAAQEDGTLAGSTANVHHCVRKAVEFGVPEAKAIMSASYVPAKLLGMEDALGVIKAGAYADLLVLDEALALEEVYIRGELFE